jgi:hypothetical protein
MCCNKRRQRGTQDTAILHAAARAVNHELHRYKSSSTSVVPGVIGEQPPPYLYPEKQPIVDKKAETYEDVAQQWLSAGGPNKRRSFSSYHSFDAEAVPAYFKVPSPSPALLHSVPSMLSLDKTAGEPR